MLKNKSLALKFIIFLSGYSAVIFILIVGSNYRFSKQLIMSNIRNNAENVALRTVNKIEAELAAIKKIPENTAYFLEGGNFDSAGVTDLLRMVVTNNKELYGMGIAFEPYAFKPDQLYFAPYYAKEKDGLKFYPNIGNESYRYFYLDWYQIPRELNRPVWSEPYFDDIIMATYSVPFYERTNEGPKLKGVICADISLEKLTKIVNSVKVLKTGDAYLISRNGTIITHAVKDLIMNETIFSVAEVRNDENLRALGRKMIRGESGFAPFVSIARNKKSWMYYAPVSSTGWTLIVVFPEDELLADIRQYTLVAGALGIAGLLLLVAVIIGLTRSITRPLRKMSKAVEAIGNGDLDAELPRIDLKDEVGKFAEAFARMKTSLKDYIKKLTETTAAKERIESELMIARDIQASMLPRIFPPFPDRKEFSIYATMEPAKEVGGDFYDFFLINEKKLFFAMGDVSGKGVPAALFMMITRTLLKNEALKNLPIDQVIYNVNNILALDNSACMFATVFCGIMDTETGQVEFANAGHNPPLLYRQGKGYEFLKVEKGFVLGPMRDFKFKAEKIKLRPQDGLFLYTDGVTEAMNPQKQLFSEERLRKSLLDMQGREVFEVISALRKEILAFARGEPQSDDITILAFRFN